MNSNSADRAAVEQFLSARIDYERMRMPYDPARIGLARMNELLDRNNRPERASILLFMWPAQRAKAPRRP